MKLTDALKKFVSATFGVAADAADDVFKKTVGDKLVSGELTQEKFIELTPEKATDAKAVLETMVTTKIGEALNPIKAMLEGLVKSQTPPVPVALPPAKTEPAPAMTPPVIDQAAVDKQINDAIEKKMATINGPTPLQVFGAHAKLVDGVRVKGVYERYDTGRKGLVYGSDSRHLEFRGQPVINPVTRSAMDSTSQADYATIGAFLKWQAACSGKMAVHMKDDEWELVKRAMEEEAWTGVVGGDSQKTGGIDIDNRKLTKVNTEALINDSLSGGQTAVPTIFEQAILQTPILYGELFPLVKVTNISSGTTVRQHTLTRPSFTDGVEEQTAISLIDITSFISYIDTTVHTSVAASEIGLDFEQDSLPDFGAAMVANFGEAAMKWLDDNIATGTGSTTPTGLFNTSGTVTVNAKNPGGAVTIQDVESLFFGVNKAFQTSRGGNRNVLVGNEVNYQRLRAIPQTPGSNMRADMSPYNSYTIKGIPYKVSTAVTNAKLCFANMAYYEMIRRLGMTVRVVTDGYTLATKNLKLFVVRMRWGGQLKLGGAMSQMADLPLN